MRVLLANKFYGPRGGAESVVFQTQRLLEEAGHEVVPFAMRHAGERTEQWSPFFVPTREYFEGSLHRRARDALAAIYSFEARRRLRELIRVVRPDIAHLHNVYHQLTFSIVDELRAAGVPIVMTLHDYKAACPNYLLLAHDGLCQRCVGGAYWNAVRHRCLKRSVAGSAIAAAEAYLNRIRRQYEKIDLFIAPSTFLRDVMIRAGLSPQRLEILPYAVRLVEPNGRSHPARPRFVYLGRLSAEKGLDDLLSASARLRARAEVVVFGQGHLEGHLRTRVAREQLPVTLGGFATEEQLTQELRSTTAAVLPSRCYENCPMSILEAGAVGVPTVASEIGGIPELISSGVDGVLVRPGDPGALAAALLELVDRPEQARTLGDAARRRVLERHAEAAHVEALLALYEHARAAHRLS